ncbi:MAG: Calx-beta domain-containing protein, partial [Pseudomonadota bacterium]
LIFRATFSEDVMGVDTADFAVNGTTTAGVTAVTPVSASVYDVTVSGGDLASFNGVVGLNFAAAPVIQDLGGNGLPNTEPGTDQTYMVDNMGPSTTSFTRQTPATTPTNADTLIFRATFSEDVTGVDTADFAVNGTTTATVTAVTPVSASAYDVTVSGGDLAGLNGIVGLDFDAAPTIQDIDLTADALPNTEPVTDETYTVDNTAPLPTTSTLTVQVTGSGEVTSNVGSINCPTNCTSVYNIGSLVTLTAVPEMGQQVGSWSGACSDAGSADMASVSMLGNRLCTVAFSPIPPPESSIVGFTQANYIVNEADGGITINVSRTGSSGGAASIDYALTAGSATAGMDYTDTAGTLNWAANDATNKSFTIMVMEDMLMEGNETLTLSLGNKSPPELGVAIDTATLTIIDNDIMQPGQAQFVDVMGQVTATMDGTMFVTVPEDAGDLRIDVSRTGGADGAVSIDFRVMPALANMATMLEDFLFMPGTLNWADEDSSNQSFILSIVDDFIEETSQETFFLELHNPLGGLLVGSPATIGITIQDNDSCAMGTKGAGFVINNNLMPIPTNTCFVDLLDGNVTASPFMLSKTGTYRTVIRIDVGPEHQGMPANLLILGAIREIGELGFRYYGRPNDSVWVRDDSGGIPATVQRIESLPASIELVIHDGFMADMAADYLFYGGYQLDDSTLIFNPGSIQTWSVR